MSKSELYNTILSQYASNNFKTFVHLINCMGSRSFANQLIDDTEINNDRKLKIMYQYVYNNQ